LVTPNGWLWFIITQPGRLVISSKPWLMVLGVQLPLGVGVAVAVAVPVGVTIGVAVGVAVGVCVAVAVAVGVTIGVAVAVGVGDCDPPQQNFSNELSGVMPSLA
jgi:hypothetical protein